jgi:hypothetical protein
MATWPQAARTRAPSAALVERAAAVARQRPQRARVTKQALAVSVQPALAAVWLRATQMRALSAVRAARAEPAVAL